MSSFKSNNKASISSNNNLKTINSRVNQQITNNNFNSTKIPAESSANKTVNPNNANNNNLITKQFSQEFKSNYENQLLKSDKPLDTNEKEEITVNGQRGIWLNKAEVVNWKGPVPIEQYLINEDPNPELIIKKLNQQSDYKQEVKVRYLKPPTPEPGEIIINQEPAKVAPPGPPLILRQYPATSKTPEPIVIREAPPEPPKSIGHKVINVSGKEIPPPPRKVIIEKLPSMPAKPPPIIIERWLPYPEPKVKIIHQKLPDNNKIYSQPKNLLIEWDEPDVIIEREIKNLGIKDMDPNEYKKKYGSTLKKSKDMPDYAKNAKPPTVSKHYSKHDELIGDIEALKLVDLDKEGLGDYKNIIYSKHVSHYKKCHPNSSKYSANTYKEIKKSKIRSRSSKEYSSVPRQKSTNNDIDIDIKNFNFKKQTREIKNGVRISSLNPTDQLIVHPQSNVRTVYDLFNNAEKITNNGSYLGWKPTPDQPYKWLKYSDVRKSAIEVGSGLIDLGLDPGKEEMVGIYARNRPEWVMTEHSCITYSFISVPLYDTYGENAVSFILNQTELRVVFCDDSNKAFELMKSPSHLKVIVIFDNLIDPKVNSRALELNIILLPFDKIKEIGQKHPHRSVPPKPNDIYTICYTSGTTGIPKGAIITHSNMISVLTSAEFIIQKGVDLKIGQEIHLSYLPLSHMFERIVQGFILTIGGSIGFYQGDPRKIQQDIKELKPTILCAVPRILNRFYTQINQMIFTLPTEKQEFFHKAFGLKEQEVSKGIINNNNPVDIAFKEIKDSFGGRVKVLITGSAPIATEILKFFRVVLGCHVLEGYGATETCGVTTFQIPGETDVGNLGPPILSCFIKLADVPEMSIVAKRDNLGEVLVHGANVFKGYYKDREKTKAAIDKNGWYHTGDIGKIDENGSLKIVDRIKNIFKLQQGEYVAPEKIESVYSKCNLISQIFVHGESLKSSLVAIVVPEEAAISALAKQYNLNYDIKNLCKMPQFKQIILGSMNQIIKDKGLKGFEQVKDIYLHPEPFSVQNNLLTPTFKLKRNELKKYFEIPINEMYKNLD